MAHMLHDYLINKVNKVSTMQHALQELFFAHFRMLIHDLLN